MAFGFTGLQRKLLARLVLTVLGAHGLAAWCADAARSQDTLLDLSLEQLVEVEVPTVVGASKYAQKATQAPSAISVVTAEEIKRYGYPTLADVLRGVRGFYVTNNRNYNFLGVRGFSRPADYNSRVLVLIDGHRINDPVYGQGSIEGVFPLDVDLIDRVEIIRGPGSSLYGTGAFFAVINVVPKRGVDLAGAEASAGLGSQHTQRGRVSFGKQFDSGLQTLVSASGYATDGIARVEFPELADDASLNNGVVDNHDQERWKSLYASLSYGDFTLSAVSARRTKFFGDGLFGGMFNTEIKNVDDNQYVDFQYRHALSDASDIQARLYYHRYEFHADELYDYPPVTLNNDLADTQWWGSEIKYTTRLGKRNRLTLGAEYVNYVQVSQRNFDAEPFFEYLNYDEQTKTWAVYAQDEISLTDQLVLSVGVRYDDLYAGRSSTNPRLGLVYSPAPDTAIKLLYGTAFRAPNGNELYYASPAVGYKTNPAIKPERIRTTELVFEQGFGKHLRGIASVYEYRIKDLITPVLDTSDNQLVYQNSQKTKANGVDLELQAKWAKLEGRVSYSFQDAENEETGQVLSNAPKHLVKLNAMAPVWGDKLSIGVEAQYTAKRTNDSADGSAEEIPGYSVANLTLLHRNWVKGLEISAGVKNLFDKQYADPASSDDNPAIVGIPQDGRTYWVKFNYRF